MQKTIQKKSIENHRRQRTAHNTGRETAGNSFRNDYFPARHTFKNKLLSAQPLENVANGEHIKHAYTQCVGKTEARHQILI